MNDNGAQPELPAFATSPAAHSAPVAGAGATIPSSWISGLTLASGKTLTVNASLTLAGTDGKALTLTGGLTVGADTTLSGGGIISLGGFTLTVPGTGTAALGSGAAGQVSYWSGANTQAGTNNLFWDSANSRLGIGTSSPGDALTIVDGIVRVDRNVAAGTTFSHFRFYRSTVEYGRLGLTATTNRVAVLGTGNQIRFTVDPTNGDVNIFGMLDHDGSTAGVLGAAPVARQNVTGSRGGNAALASLITAMATFGWVTDSSTA